MTDATGRSFLSYRRSRIAEARLLIEAQHDIGIPTWQDLSDLDEGQTERLLREAIAEKTTANAVCWLTPEVETSTVITRTELPGILKRVEADDGFFMVPVAAGGLVYADVARVAGTYLGVHDLGQWNVRKVSSDPATAEDAASIAGRVLARRVRAIYRQLKTQAALPLVLNTGEKPAFDPGVCFSIDWTHRFNGRSTRTAETWQDHLLPALRTVAQACSEHGSGRPVTASGLCALPASVALGAAFLAVPRGIPVSWRQISPNRAPQLWSLDAAPEPCGFSYQVGDSDPNAEDIAILVSVASDVTPAFGASRPGLPAFRAVVVVHKPGQLAPHDIASAGQARDLVRIIVEALRFTRDQHQPRGALHLFLAVPAGIAMMLGQMLNTFGPVQTYEHMPTDAVGRYVPAARLEPAA